MSHLANEEDRRRRRAADRNRREQKGVRPMTSPVDTSVEADTLRKLVKTMSQRELAKAYVADIIDLRSKLTAETERADKAEEVWPQWALATKSLLERFGYEYSPDDEVDLPADIEEWMEGYESSWQAKEAALQSQLASANAKLATVRDETLVEVRKYIDNYTGLHGGRKESMHSQHLIDKFRALSTTPAASNEREIDNDAT